MLELFREWYYKMDSYLMILKCDLKYWREEGILKSLHDEPEHIHQEIWENWFHHKL